MKSTQALAMIVPTAAEIVRVSAHERTRTVLHHLWISANLEGTESNGTVL